MAVTPNTDEAFLREVDEELRRDQLAGFWKRWGLWLIVAVIAGLAAFAGYLLWQHHARQTAGTQGETLQDAYDALGRNQFGQAAPPLDTLATDGGPGYRSLARFSQADVLLKNNDLKGAAAKFAAVAADDGAGKPFRDLALIRQTAAEFDTLQPQVVIERMRPLAVAGNAWLGSAGELMAAAYLRSGRRDLAGQVFATMARDEGVPATIRQRAVQMAGTMGVDAVGGGEGSKAR